jgi:hypothetical protein
VDGNEAVMLRRVVPAIDDTDIVHQVSLSAFANGSEIFAEVAVEGGKPPYTYEWTSSNEYLGNFAGSDINYALFAREQAIEAETVTVAVTDRNGITVRDTVTLSVNVQPSTESTDIEPLVGGVADYGIERAVSNMGAAQQRGFARRFNAEGVTQRFNWTGKNVWELDFVQGNYDEDYVDNADIVFYIGHGWGGGFTFESNVTDGAINYKQNNTAWGNKDLEFLSLLSCQVLKTNFNGQNWAQRWGQEFAGLHLLTGFHTNAHDWAKFGKRYAQYLLGRQVGFTSITLPVRAAWFQAKKEKQPDGNRAVVIGPMGPSGVTNYNDYFWGQGSMGPDIRGSNLKGWWRVTYK